MYSYATLAACHCCFCFCFCKRNDDDHLNGMVYCPVRASTQHQTHKYVYTMRILYEGSCRSICSEYVDIFVDCFMCDAQRPPWHSSCNTLQNSGNDNNVDRRRRRARHDADRKTETEREHICVVWICNEPAITRSAQRRQRHRKRACARELACNTGF